MKMEKESGMPAGEKAKEEWYDQEVFCGWCKKKMGTKKQNYPPVEGKPSHDICEECARENFPEDFKENEK
jgi:hypothetical protein